MKRLWIGLAVLTVLLFSGWAVSHFMERCHEPIYEDLMQAARSAAQGDWHRAEALAASAREQWQQCRDFTAAFADHSVLEEVDSLFAEVDIYIATREHISFAATCAHLAQLAQAIAQSHCPMWQNLL